MIINLLMAASIITGVQALRIPIVNIYRRDYKSKSLFLSLSACNISLLCQLFYHNYLVKIQDLEALIDTSYASTLSSMILLIFTILLNFINYKVNSKMKQRGI